MAAGKEIRGKIKSVENTKKITKAMEMVAASKMRKAQERMRSARPYSEKVRNIAANLGKANPEYTHAFMKTNDVKAAGVIVVSTDKGLCGGLNTNVLRAVTGKLRELQGAGYSTQTVAIGNKGLVLLETLLQSRGQAVSKERLMDAAWPGPPASIRTSRIGARMTSATSGGMVRRKFTTVCWPSSVSPSRLATAEPSAPVPPVISRLMAPLTAWSGRRRRRGGGPAETRGRPPAWEAGPSGRGRRDESGCGGPLRAKAKLS